MGFAGQTALSEPFGDGSRDRYGGAAYLVRQTIFLTIREPFAVPVNRQHRIVWLAMRDRPTARNVRDLTVWGGPLNGVATGSR